MQVLRQHLKEEEAFLQWIVTGDETWMHHYEPTSKHQSVEWKHASSPRTKRLRSVPSAGKVMLMLFCDFNGSILKQYQNHGQMISSAQYYAILEEELELAVHSKQRNADKWSCSAS
jgi:hypothetical protein